MVQMSKKEKSKSKGKSIRYYYFTSITTVLIASVLVMGIIQAYLATAYFKKEKINLLEQVALSVARAMRRNDFSIQDEASPLLNRLADAAGAVMFITDLDGRIITSEGHSAPPTGTLVSADIIAQIDPLNAYSELGDLSGTYSSRFYTFARIVRNYEGQVTGYVFVSTDAVNRRKYIIDTLTTFLLSATIVLLFSSLVALGLTNRTVIPIKRISGTVRRFADGDYSARVPEQGDDELAQLSKTFNEMAASIEATDTSRRNFIGNLAHELRTPMTSIKGFIDGMKDGTIPVEKRDHYLSVVSDEVGRLSRLIKNMLDISRIEAGEYNPTIVPFDIWAPITAVILADEQRLTQKNISVCGLEHTGTANVLADEDFIHQVLYNLVDNAIKFTDEGGTISVGVRVGKPYVTVGIRNTGPGMDDDTLRHVFDRFYKADKSRGLNAKGAGLGLHICKVLVGLLGGRLNVESEEGEWTEFLFTLPAAPPKKKN